MRTLGLIWLYALLFAGALHFVYWSCVGAARLATLIRLFYVRLRFRSLLRRNAAVTSRHSRSASFRSQVRVDHASPSPIWQSFIAESDERAVIALLGLLEASRKVRP